MLVVYTELSWWFMLPRPLFLRIALFAATPNQDGVGCRLAGIRQVCAAAAVRCKRTCGECVWQVEEEDRE